LIIVAAVTSAISAWYYLRLIGLALLSSPQNHGDLTKVTKVTLRWPLAVAVIGACIAIGGPVILEKMMENAKGALQIEEVEVVTPSVSPERVDERV
jgi:NADH:ubiquinone oxidoreductase subunit 2 (subunit N)